MEALHRQVLPFLLRRMKEDVLQDLPPKIIQDYYCNLSPLQVPAAPNRCLIGAAVAPLLTLYMPALWFCHETSTEVNAARAAERCSLSVTTMFASSLPAGSAV